jgi:hypothetical protein
MNSSFTEVWSDIRRRLRVDTIIRNWSVHGYTGKTFDILSVDNTVIRVSSPRMQDKGKGLLVSRGEFESFFPLWPDYKGGRVQRKDLTAVSQRTTYVISILHWQETMLIDHLWLTRRDGSKLQLNDVEVSGDVRQIGAIIKLTTPALGVISATVDRIDDRTTASRTGTSRHPADATGPLTVWATETP